MLLRLSIFLLTVILLTGCWGEPESGPVDIRYDREECAYCRMIISDPRFAAEIRKAKGEDTVKFGDIGDAIHWLNEASWKPTAETEFWVRDLNTGKKWLDARKVWYLPDQVTPMDYGYGAVEEKTAKTVSFEEMQAKVIARGSTSRCTTPLHDHPNAAPKEQPETAEAPTGEKKL